MAVLEVNGVRKSFGKSEVLKGASLKVEEKELVTIIGASGAGKSTLLHIIGTLDNANAGSVSILGTDTSVLKGNKLADFRNKNIGFVFQFHNLLPEFSALENIMLPGFIGKKDKKAVKERAEMLLNEFGLFEKANSRPSQLSGGEQQRIAVARSLINEPAIVFADEPSGNLDEKNAAHLHELFIKLTEDFNYTFLAVTHNTEFSNMAHRRLTLKEGVIITE